VTIKAEKYTRRPFDVEAIEVSEEKMQDIANWCMGDIQKTELGVPYIHVRVHHPMNGRQTMAFVGDMIVYSNKGYKVYTARSFEQSFMKVENPARK